VKFFFDNNLAVKIAHGLDQMVRPEHRVVHLRDEFLPNVEDAVWMKALAKEEDLVIVTADVAISRNRTREQFTRCFPEIIKEAMPSERSAAFTVKVNGKIESLK
jgi:PIN like domain